MTHYVEVTQADRNTAADVVRQGGPGIGNGNKVAADRIKSGMCDEYAIVQTFARHRIAAEQASAATIAELREVLVLVNRDANMRIACDIEVMTKVIEHSYCRIADWTRAAGSRSDG